MSPTQIACALLVPLFWGVQFVVIKVGLTAFPPLFFVGLRFAAVAAILLPFVGRPTRRELGPMIAISVFFGGLNFALFFVGLGQGLASVSAVANQLSTPFTVLLAWPFLGERPSTRVVIGVALAFGGVALTVAAPSASVKIMPTLLVIAAGFAWAVGSVLTKRYGPFEPLKLMAWMSLFTVPQVMATSLVIEHGQLASLQTASLTAWLAFAYTVLFGAVAGWGLWFWLIARCSMTRVAPFALLQTVFAIVAGVVFLHEPLTPTLAAGAAVCIAGVAITQIRSFARHSLPTAPRAPVEPRRGPPARGSPISRSSVASSWAATDLPRNVLPMPPGCMRCWCGDSTGSMTILPRTTLVLGGARSGKSAYAERLIRDAAPLATYLATAEAGDGEMSERIAHHRASRGAGWVTIEEPLDLVGTLRRAARPDRPVLVDCLTLWLSNLMHAGRDVAAETAALAGCFADLAGPVVLVSNEVGQGIVPDNTLARAFRDHAGRLHQAVAAAADRVVFVTAGLPMLLKSRET